VRRVFVSLVLALVMLGVAFATAGSSSPGFQGNPAIRMALDAQHGIAPPRLPNGNFVAFPSGGYVHSALEQTALHGAQAQATPAAVAPPTIGTTGCPHVFSASGRPDNIRANQDCGYRSQSEEWVAVNPNHAGNVIVSQNDSSLSGNHTGVDFSVDGGRHFGDSKLPSGRITIPQVAGGEWSFDFFSDPVHAFDAQGNLYYVTLGADFAQDAFDGLFVWKSNSCLRGSALHTPGSGQCSPFRPPIDASAIPIRTNFANPGLSDDKEQMAVDTSPASSHKGNLYVTWTLFDFTCGTNQDSFCGAPIFFSRSANGGQSWSHPKEISGASTGLCKFGNIFDPSQPANACNNDQYSDPVVGPNGTLYVFYMNFNTNERTAQSPSGLLNQILMVKSKDGGTTWSQPTRVAWDFGGEPYSLPGHEIRDCDDFRQCLPPNGYRMSDYPAAGINRNGKLAVYWSDFRNGGPCAKDTDPGLQGLPVTPCKNINVDIMSKTSSNGGRTWSHVKNVTPAGHAAQWQPWGAIGRNGAQYVAYYDRRHGACESTGCNDITLSRSFNDGNTWASRRITTSSMPNLTCAINPNECGFLGDYMGLALGHGKVHMTWGDTRGLNHTTEEDVYYSSVPAGR
jgi:hypothetical protein